MVIGFIRSSRADSAVHPVVFFLMSILFFTLAVSERLRAGECINWQLQADGDPPPRDVPAMAYDASRLRTVLFGGYSDAGNPYLRDTWMTTGTDWLLASTGGPEARFLHAMAFDTSRARVVLFGGQGEVSGYLQDTWEWDSSNLSWSLRATTGPPARHGHALAYDSRRERLVLFGGFSFGQYLGDTWEWDGSNWSFRASSGPSPRDRHTMAYDEGRGVTVLFGGDGGSRDTWEWDGNSWTLRQSQAPMPSPYPRMTYDSSRERVVLFSAPENASSEGSLWTWDGADWSLLAVGGPSYRDNAGFVFDAASHHYIVAFGRAPSGLNKADTWTGVDDSPSLSWPPLDLTVPIGGSAVFSLVARGAAPLQIQWQKGGLELPGETTDRLRIAPVVAGSAGPYEVVLSNSCGQLSAPADLTAMVSLDCAARSALSFDGSTDVVRVGPRPELRMVDTFTLEAWVRPTGGGNSPFGQAMIINKEGEYEIARFQNGRIHYALANDNPGWNWTSTNYLAPENAWSHLAFTYDHGLIRFLANGSLAYSRNGAGTIGDNAANVDDFSIGDRQIFALRHNFQGQIDEVRVWNIARSQQEIAAAMNRPLTGLEAGLVGYWRFDEGEGQVARDATPNGLHGMLGGDPHADGDNRDPSWTTITAPITTPDCDGNGTPDGNEIGPFPVSALRFDGVNDTVQAPDSASLDLSDAATIEFWMAPEEFTNQTFSRIIEKGDGVNCCSDRSYEVEIFGPTHPVGKRMVFTFFLGTSDGIDAGHSFEWIPGVWMHVAGTFDRTSGAMHVYLNGELVDTDSRPPDGPPIRNSTRPLVIGAVPPFGLFYKGKLDEVRIWNVARSQAQIQSSMKHRLTGQEPGLVGYWRFDEGTGVTAIDHSPFANHGTLFGPQWCAMSRDCDANCVLDSCEQCGDFDGNLAVDGDDFAAFLLGFGSGPLDAAFLPCADADLDGAITIVDYQTWIACYRDFVANPGAPPPMPSDVGDLNADGWVDAGDIQRFVAAIIRPEQADLRSRIVADLNGDGSIDVADVAAFAGMLILP